MDLRFSSVFTLLLYLFYLGLALYFIYDLIFKKHNPVKSLSWIVVMLLLPYIGLILYIYVGRDYRRIKIYSRKGLHDERLKKELSAQQVEQLNATRDELPDAIALGSLLVITDRRSAGFHAPSVSHHSGHCHNEIALTWPISL